MLKSTHLRRFLALGAASLALLFAACDSDRTGSSEPAEQADRGSADATSLADTGRIDEPVQDTEPAPRRDVISEQLPYAEVDDELFYGYFVFPADMIEPLPAVIMIHERWGLNDYIRAAADRLAAEGYIVLAIDLFAGQTATGPAQARKLTLAVAENAELAAENIRQAYHFVTSIAGAPRVGALGWSFGGGWSLQTAMLFPDDLDAAVIYYGDVTDNEDELRPVQAPILGLFGARDRAVAVEAVQRFEAALEHLRKNYEIQIYPGAERAFANPSARGYDRALADDAWRRTLEFLRGHLGTKDGEEP